MPRPSVPVIVLCLAAACTSSGSNPSATGATTGTDEVKTDKSTGESTSESGGPMTTPDVGASSDTDLPPAGTTYLFRSFDVVTQNAMPQGQVSDPTGTYTASLEFFRSETLESPDYYTPFIDFVADENDPGAPGRVVNAWGQLGPNGLFPYVGKNTTARSSSDYDTNAPAPAGVFDLQIFPPTKEQLTVVAFSAPVSGYYAMTGLAAHVLYYKDPGDGVVVRVFGSDQSLLRELKVPADAVWTSPAEDVGFGLLEEGDQVYVALGSGTGSTNDSTEVAFTITAIVPDGA